jgi:predicted small secreted protein
MKFQIFILTIASFLLSGCASIPMAGTDLDSQAKSFQNYDQLSNIYVYKESGFFGSGITWSLKLDGQLVGAIRSGNFMLLVVPPGLHTISSLGDYGAARGGEKLISVNAMPSGKYFIYQDAISRIWGMENSLQEVDEKTGRKGVLKTDLVLTTQSIQDIDRAKFASPETISAPRSDPWQSREIYEPIYRSGGCRCVGSG